MQWFFLYKKKKTSVLSFILPPDFYCKNFQTYRKGERPDSWTHRARVQQPLAFCHVCCRDPPLSFHACTHVVSCFFSFHWITCARLAHARVSFVRGNNVFGIPQARWQSTPVNGRGTMPPFSPGTLLSRAAVPKHFVSDGTLPLTLFLWVSVTRKANARGDETYSTRYTVVLRSWFDWVANKPGVTKIVSKRLKPGYRRRVKESFELRKLI